MAIYVMGGVHGGISVLSIRCVVYLRLLKKKKKVSKKLTLKACFWWNFCFIFIYVSVHSLSHVRLFVTPWIAARLASLSIINSQSSAKLMSIESVMPSSHLICCRPLLLLPSIPPSIRVFSNESALRIRWPNPCITLRLIWRRKTHSKYAFYY